MSAAASASASASASVSASPAPLPLPPLPPCPIPVTDVASAEQVVQHYMKLYEYQKPKIKLWEGRQDPILRYSSTRTTDDRNNNTLLYSEWNTTYLECIHDEKDENVTSPHTHITIQIHNLTLDQIRGLCIALSLWHDGYLTVNGQGDNHEIKRLTSQPQLSQIIQQYQIIPDLSQFIGVDAIRTIHMACDESPTPIQHIIQTLSRCLTRVNQHGHTIASQLRYFAITSTSLGMAVAPQLSLLFHDSTFTSSIHELHISANPYIHNSVLDVIGGCIQKCTNLQLISLEYNPLKEGIPSIAHGLRENKSLLAINLNRTSLRGEEVEMISTSISSNPSHPLRYLCFEHNSTESSGSTHWTNLTKLPHIKVLNLINLQICPNHAQGIAMGLKENQSIEYLELADNNVGDEGAIALGDALRVHRHIVHLNLKVCSIGDTGAIALFQSLINHPSLTYLSLGGNRIGDSAMQSLHDMLTSQTRISTLNLMSNRIGPSGARILAQALSHNYSLQSLDLLCNDIETSGADAFVSALHHNDRIEHVAVCSVASADRFEPEKAKIAQLVRNNGIIKILKPILQQHATGDVEKGLYRLITEYGEGNDDVPYEDEMLRLQQQFGAIYQSSTGQLQRLLADAGVADEFSFNPDDVTLKNLSLQESNVFDTQTKTPNKSVTNTNTTTTPATPFTFSFSAETSDTKSAALPSFEFSTPNTSADASSTPFTFTPSSSTENPFASPSFTSSPTPDNNPFAASTFTSSPATGTSVSTGSPATANRRHKSGGKKR